MNATLLEEARKKERENDALWAELGDRVGVLHDIAKDFNEELKYQHKQLDALKTEIETNTERMETTTSKVQQLKQHVEDNSPWYIFMLLFILIILIILILVT